MKMKCDVIRDLLPLYADEVASEESRILIEDHLKECADCREYLSLLKEDLPDVAKPGAEFADETASLRKIKRRMLLNKVMIVLVTLGFAIAAAAFLSTQNLTEYSGSLEENLSFELPAGYQLQEDKSDTDSQYYVREADGQRETISLYYNGLERADFVTESDAIRIDARTQAEIVPFDDSNDYNNELYCIIQHGEESYGLEYRCQDLSKEGYYSSCSEAQQQQVLGLIRSFDYHRPDNEEAGGFFSRLHHNFGTGGCIVLALTILLFVGVPIAIGLSSAIGSGRSGASASSAGPEEDPGRVIRSSDLHDSMNRERQRRGEASLPSINNVQGASSNNLARRDHSWSSVPDFFIKLFRRK